MCTYDHHIPNDRAVHAAEATAQARAQSISVIRVTQDADVGDATAQRFSQKRVMDVGTGSMPRPSSIDGTHNCKGVACASFSIVVAIEVELQDVKVGIDLGFVDGIRTREDGVDVIEGVLVDAPGAVVGACGRAGYVADQLTIDLDVHVHLEVVGAVGEAATLAEAQGGAAEGILDVGEIDLVVIVMVIVIMVMMVIMVIVIMVMMVIFPLDEKMATRLLVGLVALAFDVVVAAFPRGGLEVFFGVNERVLAVLLGEVHVTIGSHHGTLGAAVLLDGEDAKLNAQVLGKKKKSNSEERE